jgi:cation diffusion facilitator CzcD-associated flavoprotein CzcO
MTTKASIGPLGGVGRDLRHLELRRDDVPADSAQLRKLLAYLNHVADRFDLRRDIQLNTRVAGAATWGAAAGRGGGWRGRPV